MDFFAHQEQARRNTRLLVLFFGLAVIAIVVAINFALSFVLDLFFVTDPGGGPTDHSSLYLFTTLSTVALIGSASAYRLFSLSRDSEHLATLLGATKVKPSTTDPVEKKLLNVVEEMAIASGSPIPGVYVQKREPSINALAAGWSKENAWLCVTQGALEQLTRDELQGVVAHEISHILNHDIKINLRLVGVLFGILCLSKLGWVLLRGVSYGGSSRRRGGGGVAGVAAVAFTLLVVGSIGVFFARLIKAATSRQREFLADAYAVQLTRNPLGLGGAFRKIERSSGGQSRDPMDEEVSHMYLNEPIQRMFSLMSSHPSLEVRIQRLESYLGAPLPSGAAPSSPETQKPKDSPLDPQRMALMLSQLLPLAPELREASHSLDEAKAIVLAIVHSRASQPQPADKVTGLDFDPSVKAYLTANLNQIGQLPAKEQNALLSLAAATLKGMSDEERRAFLEKVKALIYLDGELEILEWSALSYLEHSLGQVVHPEASGKSTLGQSVLSLRYILTVLAEMSGDRFLATYEKAWHTLGRGAPAPTPKSARGGEALLRALDELRGLKPLEKKKLFDAFVKMHEEQLELTQHQTFFLHSVMQTLL